MATVPQDTEETPAATSAGTEHFRPARAHQPLCVSDSAVLRTQRRRSGNVPHVGFPEPVPGAPHLAGSEPASSKRRQCEQRWQEACLV